ncbi:MAG: AEC family transporter, partial [Proteobacteria bacterium]|nr:AEC family transporter [Pseudomonadota bacterium]
MLEIVALVAPVFALIGLGFLAAKSRYLEPAFARPLTMFGYKVAMPALLFRAMANAGATPVSPLRLVAAYATGMTVVWLAAALASRVILRRPIQDGPAIAMGASFSNGVMMGFPLILLALGPEAATPMAFLATCETMLLWFVGTIHMGFVTDGAGGLKRLAPVLADVATNPLLIALAAGLGWHFTGMTISPAPARLIDFLAGAAIPVALFGLGMSLAAYEIRGEIPTVAFLTLAKLALYPTLAFCLATIVYDLPRVWAGTLVLYVSMPVGANAFVFAARYDRAVASISGAVLVTTILATATVTAV